MHHVELLWDEETDARVRGEWTLLHEAGLPSQAAHRSSSNAPHTTVTMVEHWPGPDPVRAALGELPLPATLGPLACFGRGRFVLVRTLVATPDLLDLHRRVHAALAEPTRGFLAPNRWVPHVTLAHRLDAAQVARALEVLTAADVDGGTPAGGSAVVAARHWDSEAQRVAPLAGPDVADIAEGADE